MTSSHQFPWRRLLSYRNLQNRGRSVKSAVRRHSFVPWLEVLEDRCVPSLTPVDNGLLVYDNDAVDLKKDGKPGATGVYWLADANLAAKQTFGVQGINPDGSMTWETALNWVAAMNKVDNGPGKTKGYLGHDNWTLPLTPDVDPNLVKDPQHAATQSGPNGDSFGYDFSSSLFGHLFYTEFGGKAGDSVSSLPLANKLFQNFQPYYYWGGDLPSTTRSLPVDFSFGTGYLLTDRVIDFEFALPEFSVDANDKPVGPPDNNVVSFQSPAVNPTLTLSADGMTVHDATLNVNWLANANLAAKQTFNVPGINADGSMSYDTAIQWIAALNNYNHGKGYLGHNNWRLPQSVSSVQGYYETNTEMGELYYTELGSQAGSNVLLTHDSEEKLFSNFQPYAYWSGSEAQVTVNGQVVKKSGSHETFSFGNGYRNDNTDPEDMYVIPVYQTLVPSADGKTVLDTNTGITWLADANLAATINPDGTPNPNGQTFNVPNINPDGSMAWETAMDWVAAMNTKPYLGYSDWTLPTTPKHDPNATLTNNDPGSPDYGDDFGFNFYSSDMDHLYYIDFGAVAGENFASIHNKSTELFNNLQPYYYWSGTMRNLPADFSFNTGFLGTDLHIDFEYAIPEIPSKPPVSGQSIPDNNLIPPAPVAVKSTLNLNPDGQSIHDDNSPNVGAINWLADADLAATERFGISVGSNPKKGTENINPDGSMNYRTAVAWVNAMNKADYLGHDDWRLPISESTTQDYDETYTEMGELYYTELGGQAGSTIFLASSPDKGWFHNFQPYYYWSGSYVEVRVSPNLIIDKLHSHETFSFGSGYRSGNVDPNEMYVLPAFDGNVWTVTNDNDDGPGSLRAAVAEAKTGDTIEFAHKLDGTTITLQSPIEIDKLLYIVGPGADQLTISARNDGPIFDIKHGGSGTDISSLTLADARGDEGGAILAHGASFILKSIVFKRDGAVAGPGGALSVVGRRTMYKTVPILNSRFTDTAAVGGPDRIDRSGTESNGGAGYVDAEDSIGLSVVIAATIFKNDSATGSLALVVDAHAGPAQRRIMQPTIDQNIAQGEDGGHSAEMLRPGSATTAATAATPTPAAAAAPASSAATAIPSSADLRRGSRIPTGERGQK